MKKLLYISVISLLVMTSCGEDFFSATKEIEFEDDFEQATIFARLATINENFPPIFELINRKIILVSKTKSVVDTSTFELIEDAMVSIEGNGQEYTYDFSAPSGYYIPDVCIEPLASTSYQMEVDIPELNTLATASITPPPFVKINSLEYSKDDITPDDDYSYDKISIEIDDPAIDNYYQVSVFFKRQHIEESDTSEYYIQAFVFGFTTLDGEQDIVFTDELFDGERTTLEFWAERSIDDRIDPTTEAVVTLWSIPKEEYEYVRTYRRNRDANENPFAEPTVVFSNIENGIGLFSLSHVDYRVVNIE